MALVIIVAMADCTLESLDKLKELTGRGQDELVNRAILVYETIEAEQVNGGKILVQRADGELCEILG